MLNTRGYNKKINTKSISSISDSSSTLNEEIIVPVSVIDSKKIIIPNNTIVENDIDNNGYKELVNVNNEELLKSLTTNNRQIVQSINKQNINTLDKINTTMKPIFLNNKQKIQFKDGTISIIENDKIINITLDDIINSIKNDVIEEKVQKYFCIETNTNDYIINDTVLTNDLTTMSEISRRLYEFIMDVNEQNINKIKMIKLYNAFSLKIYSTTYVGKESDVIKLPAVVSYRLSRIVMYEIKLIRDNVDVLEKQNEENKKIRDEIMNKLTELKTTVNYETSNKIPSELINNFDDKNLNNLEKIINKVDNQEGGDISDNESSSVVFDTDGSISDISSTYTEEKKDNQSYNSADNAAVETNLTTESYTDEE